MNHEQFLSTVREHPLVKHALENNCHDNDCELHNLDVALAEEVIGPSEFAYYIAGGLAMADLIYHGLSPESADAEFFDQLPIS